jgi:predicted membrane-bound spermidine synthase
MNTKSATSSLLVASFLEGGTLMAFEILSGKLYTPFLGSSIYVWTSILTLTLAGLAIGYRIGGKLSVKQPVKYLKIALTIAALTIALAIVSTAPILEAMLDMDVRTASLLGGVIILFVPVTAMGMVSPLIVGILNSDGIALSMASGLVYGIGTLGGIVMLLLTTFVLIPSIGVSSSTLLMSLLLLVALVLVFIAKPGKDAQ